MRAYILTWKRDWLSSLDLTQLVNALDFKEFPKFELPLSKALTRVTDASTRDYYTNVVNRYMRYEHFLHFFFNHHAYFSVQPIY